VDTAVDSGYLIKTRSNATAAVRAGDEAILTEALTAGLTNFHMGAVLLTPGTPDRTSLANKFVDAVFVYHSVRYQMTTALSDATMTAFGQAGMANSVTTHGAGINVFGTGALPTCPAHLAALIAALLTANGTGLHTARTAHDFLTSSALLDAFITSNMTVLVQRNIGGLLAARVATRPFRQSRIAIVDDPNVCFSHAIGERHFRHGHRHLKHSVAE
jgi:hypothetical protein